MLNVFRFGRYWLKNRLVYQFQENHFFYFLRKMSCSCETPQQRLHRKELNVLKVAGEVDPADLFTKQLESRNKLDQVVGLFSCSFLDGRATIAPTLKSYIAFHLAHDPVLLPHQQLPEDTARFFE